jgi:phage shock protein A
MSDIFSKIVTAVRAGAREISESVVDANAIRIYEQEIKDAKASLISAKQNLTQVMAREIQCEREIQHLKQDIETLENRALEALDHSNDSLMDEVVEKISKLDQTLVTQLAVKREYSDHILRLKDLMKKAEQIILEHERELAMVKTTDSVQKATRSIMQSYGSGTTKLLNAKSSMERIKHRQKTTEDRWTAEEILEKELNGSPLGDKPKASDMGDTDNVKNAILERIRKRSGK